MIVQINVDELQFKELIEGELKNLSPEKLQEIIYDSIRVFLRENPKVIRDLFVDSSHMWRDEPTTYLKQLIKQNLKEDEFKDIQDEVIQTLRDNYDSILRDAVIDIMLRGMFGSPSFDQSVCETLNRIRMENCH